MTPRTKTLGGWAVLLTAVLICALGGWSYAQARGDDDLAYAKSRDTALADGKQHLARLNSLDGKDAKSVEAGLGGWLQSSTGPLHDQLKRTRNKDASELTKSGSTARGKVTDAALTALDERTGTAQMIATVDVQVTPRTGKGGTERKRFEATLARTADGWKVKALTAIPVGSGT
jgi:Mce-associated membrane protein